MEIRKKSKVKTKNGYVYAVSIAHKDYMMCHNVIEKVSLKQKKH